MRYWRLASFLCVFVPAELDEGSWLVEGRLASSDGWAGSSASVCDTASSASALQKYLSDSYLHIHTLHLLLHYGVHDLSINWTSYGTTMKVNCEAELVWVDLRAHVYLSPASMNMSSLSSTPLGPAGALRPGVEVLTMGTDWEACSIASDATVSDKIVTEWIKKRLFNWS